MVTWFKIAINDGEGYMKCEEGQFIGYFDASGQPVEPQDGTTVYVTENDVAGPV